MKDYKKLKITMIGAGSTSFCPATLSDILLSDLLNSLPLEVCLMDIDKRALEVSTAYAEKAVKIAERDVKLWSTLDLDAAVKNADFVITAIEVDRYHYWSMDFHIPRRYGFRQVYGENGGPGGMFHTLRNLGPMLHIAERMEELCPEAWLINYTNPEAKLVEAVNRLTKIKAVGLCHGFGMGVDQVAKILEIPKEELDIVGYGLNHFGWLTSIKRRSNGENLYPLFKKKEAECHWLANWDEIALSRMMYRIYGLYPYPGTNHIGEYIAWSDEFLASTKIQYFFDPVREHPWETKKAPRFVYDFCSNPTGIDFHDKDKDKEKEYEECFTFHDNKLRGSEEYGIPIIEAIVFNLDRYIPSTNMPNKGTIPGIMKDMCVEGPCRVDGDGIHPIKVDALPDAISAMINQQGAIHRLVIDAYVEKSKNKLLQAVLLDPTISNYNNAVALIDEMCERQKEILPELNWNL
ncbi:MAG TPA: alpha-galactosidase [Lachnospiraceae bacterium]|jgi:alpha-galactosidase|nr:alpha-galactosidase [Lachnospiraceae bacterium]HCM11593.1 alpha-galactosidase [Lachnospiraceae bacterium]